MSRASRYGLSFMIAFYLSIISCAVYAQQPVIRPSSGNFYSTQRYFGTGGRYQGYSRTYNYPSSSYRSYFYNNQGIYSGQQVGRLPR